MYHVSHAEEEEGGERMNEKTHCVAVLLFVHTMYIYFSLLHMYIYIHIFISKIFGVYGMI